MIRALKAAPNHHRAYLGNQIHSFQLLAQKLRRTCPSTSASGASKVGKPPGSACRLHHTLAKASFSHRSSCWCREMLGKKNHPSDLVSFIRESPGSSPSNPTEHQQVFALGFKHHQGKLKQRGGGGGGDVFHHHRLPLELSSKFGPWVLGARNSSVWVPRWSSTNWTLKLHVKNEIHPYV